MTKEEKETQKETKRLEAIQALPPSSPTPTSSFVRETIKELRKESPKLENEAKALMEMTQGEGWKLMRKFFDGKKKKLTDITSQSIRSKGFDFQNIGFAYLLLDQITAAYDDAVNYAELPMKLKEFEGNEEGDDKDY